MNPELLLLIGISFSLGFAPGPNNAVASYSAFNFGIKKTLPIIWGVGIGYTVLVVLLIFAFVLLFITSSDIFLMSASPADTADIDLKFIPTSSAIN